VDIIRVNADRFPLVDVEARVRDRRGVGLSGLTQRNFYLTEETSSVQKRVEGKQTVDYLVKTILPNSSLSVMSDTGVSSNLDSVAIFEGSKEFADDLKLAPNVFTDTLRAIAAAGNLSAVYAGKNPIAPKDNRVSLMLQTFRNQKPSPDWRFDVGLRLAGSKLVASGPRRTIFYFTHGQVRDGDFKSYPMADLASFLRNNAISLNVVCSSQGAVDPALEYLAKQSNGGVYSLFRAAGLGPVINKLQTAPTGIYYLRFSSLGESQFGTRYLPFALEAYLMKKSGRDELGFFAPLR
jgi:hypothetical protein